MASHMKLGWRPSLEGAEVRKSFFDASFGFFYARAGLAKSWKFNIDLGVRGGGWWFTGEAADFHKDLHSKLTGPGSDRRVSDEPWATSLVCSGSKNAQTLIKHNAKIKIRKKSTKIDEKIVFSLNANKSLRKNWKGAKNSQKPEIF